MRHSALTSSCLLTAVACGSALEAGEPNQRPNRLTFAPRVGFNVQAGFGSSLGDPATNPGPATGGGVDRTYDNGYVRVDSSGNAGGKTWYWGYDNGAQVNQAADTITMNAVTGAGEGAIDDIVGDPYVGGELTYTRYFFEWGRANWGLELGGAFMPVEIEDDSTLTGLLSAVSDSFSLGGIVPPAAPYAGSFQGPGVVIGDAPTRAAFEQQATFAGNRQIESTAFGIRLGPNVDIPMGKPLSMQLSGGMYLLYTDTEFRYDESVTVPGVAQTIRQSGSASEQDWTFGAYLRGQILCEISSSLGIFGNVEYLMIDDVEVRAGNHRGSLDFGNSFGCALGLAWTF